MTSPSVERDATRPPRDGGLMVAVSDEQHAVAVDADWLACIAESVLTGEGITSAEISIALVDDATIHDVNRRFLRHDCPTDVISFLLNGPDLDGSTEPIGDRGRFRSFEGEVVISGETAGRTANEIGCEPLHEVALYLIHGLLHLCGYDDRSAADRQRMRQQERRHLQNLGLHPHYDG